MPPLFLTQGGFFFAFSGLKNTALLKRLYRRIFIMKKTGIGLTSIIIALVILATQAAAAGPVFSDTGKHWAKTYIERLTGLGAIKGFPDGTFKPNGTITRAEFLAILLRAMGSDPGQPKTGQWYVNYINTAKDKGYIKDGEFADPNLKISKMEIAKVVVRALGKEDKAIELANIATIFKDDSSIAGANKGYVRVCYEYGIISGTPEGNFLPNASATRAEASKMIITFLDNRNKAVNIDTGKPANDALMMYEYNLKREVAVTSSHPEFIPRIKKGIEIMSKPGGYADMLYFSKSNKVQLQLYENKEVLEKNIWDQHPILNYFIQTEQDPKSLKYLPYSIDLYDIRNEAGVQKFKEIVKDVFPEAYDKVMKELDNKLKDTNYEKSVWGPINGRQTQISTFKGSDKIYVHIAPKNPI